MGASIKNGFMRVANEITEALINAPLNGREYRVLLFIMRQTYGYNHEEREMSLTYIAEKMNMDKSNICRILSSLKARKIIICERQEGNGPQKICINDSVEEWQGVAENDTTGVAENDTAGVAENDTAGVAENDTAGVAENDTAYYIKTENKDRVIKTEEKTETEDGGSQTQKIADMFNSICVSYPKARVTGVDYMAITFTLGRYSMQDFETVFRKAESSSFLKGGGSGNWKASFEWLVKIVNFEKVLSGKYDDKPGRSEPSYPSAGNAGGGSFDLGEWFRQAESLDPDLIGGGI